MGEDCMHAFEAWPYLVGMGHQLANSWTPIDGNEYEPFEQMGLDNENKRYAIGILWEWTDVLVD